MKNVGSQSRIEKKFAKKLKIIWDYRLAEFEVIDVNLPINPCLCKTAATFSMYYSWVRYSTVTDIDLSVESRAS